MHTSTLRSLRRPASSTRPSSASAASVSSSTRHGEPPDSPPQQQCEGGAHRQQRLLRKALVQQHLDHQLVEKEDRKLFEKGPGATLNKNTEQNGRNNTSAGTAASTTSGSGQATDALNASKIQSTLSHYMSIVGEGGEDLQRMAEFNRNGTQRPFPSSLTYEPHLALEVSLTSFVSRRMLALQQRHGSASRRSLVGEKGEKEPSAVIDPQQRLCVFRDAVILMAYGMPKLRPVLIRIADEMDFMVGEYETVHTKSQQYEKLVNNFEENVGMRMTQVKKDFSHQITAMVNQFASRDGEIVASQSLASALQERVKTLEKENEDLNSKLKGLKTLLSEQTKELNVKRAVVHEIQHKTNDVIKENLYLRGIAAHSAELLDEIEFRKDDEEEIKKKYEDELGKMRMEMERAQELMNKFHDQVKSLKIVIGNQQEEISLFKQANSENRTLAEAHRKERDMLMTSFTPRPDAQKAASVLSKEREWKRQRISTAEVVNQLIDYGENHRKQREALAQRTLAQTKIVEFLQDDDYEKLDISKVPAHSKVCVGLGSFPGVPAHLQYSGFIAVRSFSLDELLAMIDDMRNTKTSLVPETHPLDSTFLSLYFNKRYSNSGGVFEMAYAFESAMQVYSFIPQVELFAKILAQLCPEILYDLCSRSVASMYTALRLVLSKIGTQAEKKRKVLKKRVLWDTIQQVIPFANDSDLLRLKGLVNSETLRLVGADSRSAKDEVPIAVLTGSAELAAEDRLIVEGSVPNTANCPFAAAIYRLFMTHYEHFRGKIIEETARIVSLPNDASAAAATLSPTTSVAVGSVTRERTPAVTALLSKDETEAALSKDFFWCAHCKDLAESGSKLSQVIVKPSQLAEAIRTVDPAFPDVSDVLDKIFWTSSTGETLSSSQVGMTFSSFLRCLYRTMLVRSTKRPEEKNPSQPIDTSKISDASAKNMALLKQRKLK